MSLLCCSANLRNSCMYATVGRFGIHREQGWAFACCTKTHYPARCPPPHPRLFTLSVTPSELPPFSCNPACPIPPYWLLLLFQFITSMRPLNNERSMHTNPGMCLNVAGWVSPSSQRRLCVHIFSWEKEKEIARVRRVKMGTERWCRSRQRSSARDISRSNAVVRKKGIEEKREVVMTTNVNYQPIIYFV